MTLAAIQIDAQKLLGAALADSMACVALAIELQAASLKSAKELRKPPGYHNSQVMQRAEAVARSRFPELFRGEFERNTWVNIEFDRSGAVLSAKMFGSEPTIADMAAEHQDSLDMELPQFMGWFGPNHTKGLYLAGSVLKWPHDPTRSRRRVLAAVAARYPEFFRPHLDTIDTPDAKVLTVFMNDDGTINRDQFGVTADINISPLDFPRLFAKLGIDAEQLGRSGMTVNTLGLGSKLIDDPIPVLYVNYAWPRRPGEVLEGPLWYTEPSAPDQKVEQAEDRLNQAIVKRYFPDIWANGPGKTPQRLWIVFDPLGNVWDAGRRPSPSWDGMNWIAEMESLYPGIRVGQMQAPKIQTARGSSVEPWFVWLAADSPVLDRSAVDYSKQNDLVMGVEVYHNGKLFAETPLTLKFGVPTTRDFKHVLRFQVAAFDASPAEVDLQLRLHVLTGTSAVERASDWAPTGPALRVAYDKEAAVELADDNGQSWRILMRPWRPLSDRRRKSA